MAANAGSSAFGRPTPPTQQPAAQQNQPPAEKPIPDLQSRLRALQQAEPAPQAPRACASGVTAAAADEPARADQHAAANAIAAFGKPRPVRRNAERTFVASDIPPPPAPPLAAAQLEDAGSGGLLASGVDQAPDHELLLKRAHIIEETLPSFGAPGRVVDVRTGPVVTQFGVEPDYVPGRGGKKNRVKVGAIAALDKDLQFALGAKSIRIEAPVPGKGYVGIEVPNEKAEIVHLRDVLEFGGVQESQVAAGDCARSGGGRHARRRRPRLDAAPADRRDDRVRQIGAASTPSSPACCSTTRRTG